MAVQRIDKLQAELVVPQQVQQQQFQRRLDLFSTSAIETSAPSTIAALSGLRTDIPGLSEQQKEFLAAQQAQLSPAQVTAVQGAAQGLSNAITAEIATNPNVTLDTSSNKFRMQLQQAWTDYSAAVNGSAGLAQAQTVTSASSSSEGKGAETGSGGAHKKGHGLRAQADALTSTSDSGTTLVGLASPTFNLYASKMMGVATVLQDNMQFGKDLSTDMTQLNDLIGNPDTKWPQTIDVHVATYDATGNVTGISEKSITLNSKDDAQSRLQDLQQQKSSMSDVNQMTQENLQEMMQNYSSAVNLITDMVQQTHQELMAIVNNIKT
jgi:hypothetical protein